MTRGDVVTVAGGPDYFGKPRPAVIIQSDAFSARDSRILVLLSSRDPGALLFRIKLEPTDSNGLREQSFAMIDKITAVPLSRIGPRIGRLSDQDMLRINAALVMYLGIEGASTR